MATSEDFQAQFDFLSKVRDKVSEANQAIIDIRKTKEDLVYLKKKVGSNAQYKELNQAIKKFEEELIVIENNIHQIKNRSRQDPLNYGIKLNNRLAFLLNEQGQGDYRPTRQSEEVRIELTKKINSDIQSLRTVISTHIEVIKKIAKDKGVETVI